MIFRPGSRPEVVRTEEETVRAVMRAREQGAEVRARGAGGSKNEVTRAPGVRLEMAQPDRVEVVGDGLVRAPASMTSGRLQALLRDEGLMLPTVGEWKNATLAGALATGTHGGSARHGIMSTSLERVRIVTGTGAVRDIGREDDDFRHVGVSLGALGMMTSLTLRCEPRAPLAMETDVIDFDAYLGDPVAQESRREFHASVWLPAARRVIRFGADRTRTGTGGGDGEGRRLERFGRWTAFARFVSRRMGLHRVVSSRLFGRRAVGDCGDILSPLDVPPRVARFRNVSNGIRGRNAAELAVPAARAAKVLEGLDAFFQDRSGPLNNPIGLRLSAPDDFTVSPAEGRLTLWLDIFYDRDPAFEEGLASVADAFEARCHWGKTLLLPPSTLRDRYPGWEAFRAARTRFDPDELFRNDFTDALGLTGVGVGTP